MANSDSVMFPKIKGRMAELGLTQRDIASPECWNCAPATVSLKLSGERPIFLDEAQKLAKFLGIKNEDFYTFFYAHEIA